jgi:hypothetical protein
MVFHLVETTPRKKVNFVDTYVGSSQNQPEEFYLLVCSGLVNCCWPSPAQSFLVWGPTGPMAMLFCLTTPDPYLLGYKIRRHIPEDRPILKHLYENLKSCKTTLFPLYFLSQKRNELMTAVITMGPRQK